MVGRSQRPAEVKGNPQRPGRLDVLGMLGDEADLCAGNAVFFQVMAQRAHGAGAKRSDRDQKRGVHLVAVQELG